MRIRIDFKILIFLFLFYLTKQIEIYIMVMVFSVVHELGHIAMGLILKMKLEKIEIIPCGLSVCFKLEKDDLEYKIKKIFVALAGPIVSLCLAIIYTYREPSILNQNILYSNILIMMFNLIPIYPLDGGRIVNGILDIRFGRIQSMDLTNKISNITMIILTIISSIAVYYLKNISIFLVCLFLWGLVLRENKKLKIEEIS